MLFQYNNVCLHINSSLEGGGSAHAVMCGDGGCWGGLGRLITCLLHQHHLLNGVFIIQFNPAKIDTRSII